MSWSGSITMGNLLQVLSEEEREGEPAHSASEAAEAGFPGYQSGQSQADARRPLLQHYICVKLCLSPHKIFSLVLFIRSIE